VSDPVQLAIVATLSPIIFAVVMRFLARADKREDWARQDRVAARVSEAATKVAEVAKTAAASEGITQGKLDHLETGQQEIHKLVNSNLTASMKDARDSTALLLVALEENVADKAAHGKEPNPATLVAIATAKAKIAELDAQLTDRARVQVDVDAQIAAEPA